MSGPAPTTSHDHEHPARECVQVFPAHEDQVGELTVRRSLPQRKRRMVGAWCFADHMGPVEVEGDGGINVGPHPHIGLQTVTWLIDGEIHHKDSLGSSQVIRPGQVNLMSAGRGVSHSEESTGSYAGTLEGIQLWIAQTDATRWDPPAFRHHAELPTLTLDGGTATIFVGALGDRTSPENEYGEDVVGADLSLTGPTTVPVRADHEYAIVVLRGAVDVEGTHATPGALYYLGNGRNEIRLDVAEASAGPVRVILIGGKPFEEEVLMWWNLVARTWDEMQQAADDWAAYADRFGHVDSHLERHTGPTSVP